ncbi:MAG: Hpt domain-containing protein [Planctomycetaceae bacterium]
MSTELDLAASAVSPAGFVPDIFDPREALQRTCDDLDLLAELAELFAENRDQLLDSLSDAVSEGHAENVDRAAHALKGSISTFTTLRPYHLARELEFCGKEQRLEAAGQLLAALKSSLRELEAAVQNYLNSAR